MLLHWFDRSWVCSRTWYHTNLDLYLDTCSHAGGHIYFTCDSDRYTYPDAQQHTNHNSIAIPFTNRNRNLPTDGYQRADPN